MGDGGGGNDVWILVKETGEQGELLFLAWLLALADPSHLVEIRKPRPPEPDAFP